MRDLSTTEIEQVLRSQRVGRLAVYDRAGDHVYIVPISYVFWEGAPYFHSAPGLKMELLHDHPDGVGFEIDDIRDEGEWRSVSAWGHFEEVPDPAQRLTVLEAFGERIMRGPLRAHENVGRTGEMGSGEVVYRIVLRGVTGRAETTNAP